MPTNARKSEAFHVKRRMRLLTARVTGGTAGIFAGIARQAAHNGKVAARSNAHLLASDTVAVLAERRRHHGRALSIQRTIEVTTCGAPVKKIARQIAMCVIESAENRFQGLHL